jgi:adenylate cyclase
MLIEFASVVDAVTCAIAVQAKISERKEATAPEITFRVGISIGDIIIEGDDIFGDGVNIAAHVESECERGGVYLSGGAFDQVRSKTDFAFDYLGEKLLKNIDRPVRLYAVSHPGLAAGKLLSKVETKALPLPDKPSIAVLPFQNMSGDPEQRRRGHDYRALAVQVTVCDRTQFELPADVVGRMYPMIQKRS